MANHTAGPWYADGPAVKAVSHGVYFTVALVDRLRFTKEGRSQNARLIAAAPDMLRELRDLLKFCEDHAPGWRHEFGFTAHAAIAKAEGTE